MVCLITFWIGTHTKKLSCVRYAKDFMNIDDLDLPSFIKEAWKELEARCKYYQEKCESYESLNVNNRVNDNQISREAFDDLNEKKRNLEHKVNDLNIENRNLKKDNERLTDQLRKLKDDLEIEVDKRNNLQKNITDNEMLIKKFQDNAKEQIQKQANNFNEQNKLMKEKAAIEETNQKLCEAVDELLIREKELKNVLMERTSYIGEVEGNLTALQGKCIRYERIIQKLKQGHPTGEATTIDTNIDITVPGQSTVFENVHTELQTYKDKVQELKMRILELEEEERRAQRLTKALGKRNQTIEVLQKELSAKEEEILTFHRAKGDLIQQVELYRQRVDEKNKEKNEELIHLNEQLKFYKENFIIADKRIKDLEKDTGNQTDELERIRELNNKLMDGTYGLRNAVNETRELRAMVDVRDKHIADLVSQLNSMDKMLYGLSKKISPDFNMEEFLDNYHITDHDEDKIRIEKASKDLQNKIRLLKERGPTAQIKVILGKDRRPIKTVVVEGEEDQGVFVDNNEPMSHSQRAFRQRHRRSDANAADSISLSPKQKKRYGQKRFKPNSNKTTTLGETEVFETEVNPQRTSVEIQTSDTDLLANLPDIIFGPKEDEDRDEWVVELRRKLIEASRERDKWRRLYESIMRDLENAMNENKNLLDTIQNLKDEINDANKSGRSPSLKNISPKASASLLHSTLLNPNSYDRGSLTDRAVQVKPRKVDIANTSIISFEVAFKPKLQRVSFADNAIISPSPEEKEIFDAKQNALRTELEAVRQEATKNKHQVEAINDELKQQLAIRDRLQATIDALNQKLNEQRDIYKETLTNLRNEADRYADTKVKEAIEAYQISSRINGNGSDKDADLSSVSTRIAELNHLKAKLEEELSEEKASSAMAQKQAQVYRQKLKAMEAERDELQADLRKKGNDNQLQEYNAELHLRMRNLEKRYQDLKRENYELKHARPARNDPGAANMHTIDESDTPTTPRDTSRAQRNAETRIMALRTQNEEMQLRLGKANGTIDRLNQLLQRKEAQITKLKEQSSAFKQQIISKQREISSLRNRFQK